MDHRLRPLLVDQAGVVSRRRLLHAAAQRERLPRRGWIESVLADVAARATSVLEHGYLTLVERPHGLAVARRQVRDRLGAGTVNRDVEYDGGLVVDLDGRLFHDTTAQRDRDLDRDLMTAVLGKSTVRLSYGQVYDRPCLTAGRLALLLRGHGWRGRRVAAASAVRSLLGWSIRVSRWLGSSTWTVDGYRSGRRGPMVDP